MEAFAISLVAIFAMIIIGGFIVPFRILKKPETMGGVCSLGRHKWSKWEQYKCETTTWNNHTGKMICNSIKVMQRRNCMVCNKMQTERVYSF